LLVDVKTSAGFLFQTGLAEEMPVRCEAELRRKK
jgi:hypothetical protein